MAAAAAGPRRRPDPAASGIRSGLGAGFIPSGVPCDRDGKGETHRQAAAEVVADNAGDGRQVVAADRPGRLRPHRGLWRPRLDRHRMEGDEVLAGGSLRIQGAPAPVLLLPPKVMGGGRDLLPILGAGSRGWSQQDLCQRLRHVRLKRCAMPSSIRNQVAGRARMTRFGGQCAITW